MLLLWSIALTALALAAARPLQPTGAHVLQQEMPTDFREPMGRNNSLLPSNAGIRQTLDGEPAPEEGMREAPLYVTRVEGLVDLLLELQPGERHKVRVSFDDANSTALGFLIWLPSGFASREEPWPTVFHLHGRGETSWASERTVETDNQTIANLVHHGLPHRLPERMYFNSRFVMVAPQAEVQDPATGVFDDVVPVLEMLRVALFTRTSRDGAPLPLDRSRVYLTGLSFGGTGTWAWAIHSVRSGTWPWAAIAPCSGKWPVDGNRTDPTPFWQLEAPMLRRLARENIHVAHCVNDLSAPIDTGMMVGPKCLLADMGSASGTLAEQNVKCDVGADAIVEALQYFGAGANVQYERIPFCHPSHEPFESSFVPMYGVASAPFMGHDSWSHLYSSHAFFDWLLSKRLAPEDRWWSGE